MIMMEDVLNHSDNDSHGTENCLVLPHTEQTGSQQNNIGSNPLSQNESTLTEWCKLDCSSSNGNLRFAPKWSQTQQTLMLKCTILTRNITFSPPSSSNRISLSLTSNIKHHEVTVWCFTDRIDERVSEICSRKCFGQSIRVEKHYVSTSPFTMYLIILVI